MKKKAAAKECSCLEQVQIQLKPRGAIISRHLQIGNGVGRMSPPSIVLEKVEGSKAKLPTVFCSYCPFCGRKYK